MNQFSDRLDQAFSDSGSSGESLGNLSDSEDALPGETDPSNPGDPDRDPLTHTQFLTSAGLFEGGLLVAAFVAGAWAGIPPTDHLWWSAEDFGLGLLAILPMLVLLAVCFLSPAEGLKAIRVFLRDSLGPLLDRCRLTDLLYLALLAGVCEEFLFRGFLYFWIRSWNTIAAVLICNLLFALAHAITPMYALLAGVIGLYLTALLAVDPTPNLLIPITAHAAYDFIAFVVVVRDYRKSGGVGDVSDPAVPTEP